jgi:DNA-binding MarR family transcriptional regulator
MKSEDHHGEIRPPQRLWSTPTWLIGHVAGDAHRAMVDAVTAAGRTDYAILAGLDEFGPVSQAALGRRLGLDRSDISIALDRLETDGSITRAADSAHARRKLVSLTRAGRRHLRRLEAEIGGAQQRLLAPLTSDQVEQLTALLQVLVQHHRGYRPANPESEPAPES